jgi:hypothetical protein
VLLLVAEELPDEILTLRRNEQPNSSICELLALCDCLFWCEALPDLCDFCVGDPRSVDDDEDRDVDWSAQKTLQRAAERVDNGTDPLEALAAEQRARSECIDAQEAD